MNAERIGVYPRKSALLLCCARTSPTPDIVARLREVAAGDVDWECLFLLARRHSIVPLLYVQLERHASISYHKSF
jgi:hypothetical protein